MTDINRTTQPVPFGPNGGWHDSAQQAELDRQVHREQLAREGFLGTRAEAEAEVTRRIAATGAFAAEVTEQVTEPAPVADVAVTAVPETVAIPATPVE
jgi:hypothetical protein